MHNEGLQPEALMDLQIHLDRLERAAAQCRSALRRVRGGELTRADYRAMLDRQLAAQREWEAKNREYLRSRD